jgi:methanogenic corrinoid protein MtbC1
MKISSNTVQSLITNAVKVASRSRETAQLGFTRQTAIMTTINLKTTITVFQAALLLASAAASPIKLIIDTDAGFDVDDVGAISVANALQDNGEVEIVAVGHTNGLVLAPR